MSNKSKLYVDANLKVTNSLRLRKAVVNEVNGCLEITFLQPIAYSKNAAEAWQEKGKWNRRFYVSYKASLPRAESCLFANKGERVLFFKSCHTSSCQTDYHGRVNTWYMLDDKGQKTADRNEVLENVYASILLTKGEFFEINPDVDLSRFSMSTCY